MTNPPTDRLDRIESILEVVARETLANARASAENTRAISDLAGSQAQTSNRIVQLLEAIEQLRISTEQQKRAIDYLMSRDG